MGMFDSIQCSYPLPLPLEVIDILPDIYDLEFQTKDLDNVLDLYFINEDGSFSERKREYAWKDDDSYFLKGYMNVVSEKIIPHNFHGILNFYIYEIVYEDENFTKGKDISLDYVAKFTNGKLENIEILDYKISDATERLHFIKEKMKEFKKRKEIWYNKYIFDTKIYKFIKNKIILATINFLKKSLDDLYWFVVRYV